MSASPPSTHRAHGPQAGTDSEKSRAALALGLALAAWICACGPLAALPALLLARGELKAIGAGARDPSKRILAKLAWWISAVTLGLWVVVTAFNVYVLIAEPEWAESDGDIDWD